GLARGGESGGLLGLQFERDRAADDVVGALFLLWRLVDREHANIGQRDLGDDDVLLRRVWIFLAAGENDVDTVVGQDESAGAGLRRDLRRYRAISAGQDRGHEARAVSLHQFGFADRLAGNEGGARDRAGNLVGS